MKTKRTPIPSANFEELIPLLIDMWRKLHKLSPGPKDVLQTREFRSLVEAVLRLQKENDYSDKELLGAYLLYDWILHYAQGLSLIGELPSRPKKVLDLCSGAAPFALAAMCYGAQEVIAIDDNLDTLRVGAEICGKMGYPITLRKHDCRKLPLPDGGKWDLMILGYALFDLFPRKEEQKLYIQSLLKHLSEDGHLLLVDSSHVDKNRRLLSLRDALVEEGAVIQAPCIWKGKCPSLEHSSSVCFAMRPFEKPPLIKEIQRATQINLNSLKMSYLILKSPQASWPTLPEKRLYRIVSPPIETYVGTRFFLCGTDGKKSLGSRLNEHPKESRAYEFLRRGDLISITNPIEINEDLEITNETHLHLEAPVGKPLPQELVVEEV